MLETIRPTFLNKFLFYGIGSFLILSLVYALLWLILPNSVFGGWYRMILYHHEHPFVYISIPCLVYALLATIYTEKFAEKKTGGRLLYLVFFVILMLVVSAPLGGILWHLHDMQAGYFPNNWLYIAFVKGSIMGLELGWLIVLLSFPFNVFALAVYYVLLENGAELFVKNN